MTITGAPGGYPAHRIADVVLRDGSTVRVRPVLPADADALVELFEGLSDETTYMRFHTRHRVTRREIERYVNVDYRDTLGLVAEVSSAERRAIVGLANYVRIADDKAEMAIVITDRFRGRGIGSILIEHLGEAAAEAGIPTFTAEILGSNLNMLEVIRSSELPVEREIDSGVVHAEFPTSPTPGAIAAFEQREAIAAAAGVRAFLEPRSVAVIGASRDPNSIGGALFRNLLEARFNGPVYPVNAKAESVQSVAAYPSVTAVPGAVDLAVIVVPAPVATEIARECARKGVRGLLVISSGFAEVGEEGRALQDDLLEIAREHGMRVVGPNCMGLMNLHPGVALNATFAPVVPPHGRLAFSSQSGALGIAVMDLAKELGLGLSSFVSVGNKADISGNDLIQYWEQDDDTDVILLYLESFGNPRKFARIARRVSNQKPIVAVKSGRSEAGTRAAASHTGSLAAGDVAVDALFRQAGVMRTDTLDELFDVANLLAHQPLPAGDRVAILTNAGGLGVMCADACEAGGLQLPELSPDTAARLRELLPAEAGVSNPVDMIASATAEHYGDALRVLAADEKVDSIIVIFIPPLITRAEDVAAALMEASAAIVDKTVLSCFLGVRGVHEHLRSPDAVIPSHAFPESAARALARVSQYAAWRRRPEGSVPELPDIDRDRAAALAASKLEGGARWLDPTSVTDLLFLYGIRQARTAVVSTPEEVADAARDIAGPVVVKIDSRTILHKTDVGGVRLNLRSPEEAAAAAGEILAHLRDEDLADDVDGFIVQEMISGEGAEMFVGMTDDPLFGPLVACGAGGVLVELQRDVATRLTPLTDLDVDEMLRSLKTYRLLEGYRGSPRLDIPALQELLLRVGVMVEDVPQLAELDLNPVMVLPDGEGCVALDARMRIAEPTPAAPRGSRRRPTPHSGRRAATSGREDHMRA